MSTTVKKASTTKSTKNSKAKAAEEQAEVKTLVKKIYHKTTVLPTNFKSPCQRTSRPTFPQKGIPKNPSAVYYRRMERRTT